MTKKTQPKKIIVKEVKTKERTVKITPKATKIIVDFKTTWAFMWRFYTIVIGIMVILTLLRMLFAL